VTSVTAIFVPVLVFDADLHATARPIFVIVVAVVPTSVRAIPASSIVPIAVSIAILVAFAIIITVSVSSPFRTRVTVFPAHTLAVAAAHPPVAAHFTIVILGSATLGTLLPLLLGILVRLGRNCLRLRHRWSFSLLLGE
jgi:hypothetical protein